MVINKIIERDSIEDEMARVRNEIDEIVDGDEWGCKDPRVKDLSMHLVGLGFELEELYS